MKCEEKRAYPTKKAAKAAARRLHHFGIQINRPYRCPTCGCFHLTKASADDRAFHRRGKT